MANRAFTVVELLVVITILGVMAALLLPAVVTTQRLAQQAQCMSSLRQISLACAGYIGDHQGQYPDIDVVDRRPGYPSHTFWYERLLPYGGIDEGAKPSRNALRVDRRNVFKGCPTRRRQEATAVTAVTARIGYGMNYTPLRPLSSLTTRHTIDTGGSRGTYVGVFEDRITFPSQRILFGDSLVYGLSATSGPPPYFISSGGATRHRNFAIYAFHDYHSKALSPEQAAIRIADPGNP